MLEAEVYQDNQGLYSAEDDRQIQRQQKIDSFLSRLHYYLVQIWPYIYRFINGFFYYALKIIKSSVGYAVKQIRFGG